MSASGPTPSPSSRASSPLFFPPIEERVEEEEKAAEEAARCPPSPLAHYYTGLTLTDRHAWPPFLGDWAFDDTPPRRVSTGCLDDEDGNSDVQREVEESYAKDDLDLDLAARHVLFDTRHITVRKRNSVCDIEFRFPLLSPTGDIFSPPQLASPRLQRPSDLSISPVAADTPSASALTSHSSVAEWEVVRRRHSCVHVAANEWLFLLVLFVFVSLCLHLPGHHFILLLLGLQAMYYLLVSLV